MAAPLRRRGPARACTYGARDSLLLLRGSPAYPQPLRGGARPPVMGRSNGDACDIGHKDGGVRHPAIGVFRCYLVAGRASEVWPIAPVRSAATVPSPNVRVAQRPLHVLKIHEDLVGRVSPVIVITRRKVARRYHRLPILKAKLPLPKHEWRCDSASARWARKDDRRHRVMISAALPFIDEATWR